MVVSHGYGEMPSSKPQSAELEAEFELQVSEHSLPGNRWSAWAPVPTTLGSARLAAVASAEIPVALLWEVSP